MYVDINKGTASPQIVWDSLKAYAREAYIQQIMQFNVKTQEEVDKLEQQATEAEKLFCHNPSPQTKARWLTSQNTLEVILTKQVKKSLLFNKANVFATGDCWLCCLGKSLLSKLEPTEVALLDNPISEAEVWEAVS
ncbi:hypothetical protein XELAEV_18006034mg [Xenopus laevis]|uniref:Uncharacterized protein n=1 Tax=Xenopus laevis TaxID=8355 RepID=A0A974DXZ2_XENLA|nr:hypothetical protein XELAEV_18006034mg [Xenopus laevis]